MDCFQHGVGYKFKVYPAERARPDVFSSHICITLHEISPLPTSSTMADSGEKNQFKVHLGTWTNWSRGPILGATLTLEPRYGLLLLSVTTTFVGFVASRSWRIVSLILHRVYSTPEPRDALHHQRQVGKFWRT